ncbi:MAG: phage tail protein [Actinomycetota bacterium]|nr:phage tail protein [Actinomycetota bacterium]
MTLDLVLCAMDDTLAQAWETVVAGLDAVRVHRGSLLGLEVHAAVSPANSQGFMRGGIDAAYAAAFPGVEDRVRSAIRESHGGILPVGSALAVPTGVPRPAWLVSAPTMQLPGELLGDDTDHLFRAAAPVLSWWRDGTLPDGGSSATGWPRSPCRASAPASQWAEHRGVGPLRSNPSMIIVGR